MAEEIDVEAVIREYLPQVAHMSLATARDGKPRVFELHVAFDDALNLYFVSSLNAQHSQDIRDNAHISGTIVTQHFLNQKVRGVYFDGTAKELDKPDDMQQAYRAYTKRFHDSPQLVKVAKADGSARFYKVSVSDFYLIDGLSSEFAQKHHLSWNT